MIQIANDGNLLPNPVTLFELDEQGIAERYESSSISPVCHRGQAPPGQPVRTLRPGDATLNGRGPRADLTMAAALSGTSLESVVGRFLEFRVVRNPAKPDVSRYRPR